MQDLSGGYTLGKPYLGGLEDQAQGEETAASAATAIDAENRETTAAKHAQAFAGAMGPTLPGRTWVFVCAGMIKARAGRLGPGGGGLGAWHKPEAKTQYRWPWISKANRRDAKTQ